MVPAFVFTRVSVVEKKLNSVFVCTTAFLNVTLDGFMMLMVMVTGSVFEAGDGLKKTLKSTVAVFGVGVGVEGGWELFGVGEAPVGEVTVGVGVLVTV